MTITQDDLIVQIQKLNDLIKDFGSKFYEWSAGVIGGGPNKDGKYPFPVALGVYNLMPCVAQMAADAQKLVTANGGLISIGYTTGYKDEGNSTYTFKASDSGKLFILISNNPAASNTIRLALPANLPAGWNVAVIQYGDNRLRFARADDSTSAPTNSYLRNRQNFFTTAGKGSLAVAVCDSNGYFTIGGDVAA